MCFAFYVSFLFLPLLLLFILAFTSVSSTRCCFQLQPWKAESQKGVSRCVLKSVGSVVNLISPSNVFQNLGTAAKNALSAALTSFIAVEEHNCPEGCHCKEGCSQRHACPAPGRALKINTETLMLTSVGYRDPCGVPAVGAVVIYVMGALHPGKWIKVQSL